MTGLLIQQIKTTTNGGYAATIDAIDPSDSGCMIGTISTPTIGLVSARWDIVGQAANQPDTCNINITANEIVDLIGLISHLTR